MNPKQTIHRKITHHKVLGSTNDISDFLSNRRVKAVCPRCEIRFRCTVRVQKHLIIKKALRKFCPNCEKYAEKSYQPDEKSVGWTGGRRPSI